MRKLHRDILSSPYASCHKSLSVLLAGWAAAVTVLGCGVFSATAMPIISHIYELSGNFEDSLGGPQLISQGGFLNAARYTFAPARAKRNQGLTLTKAVRNDDDYSIEMKFRISNPSGFAKLIDFDDLASDSGLYNHNGRLSYHNVKTGLNKVTTGSNDVFSNGIDVHVVATRDGPTKEFVGYADGRRQFSFTDLADSAVFDAPNNIMHLFQDDSVTAQREVTAGEIDYIRIYDGVLTQRDVKHLFLGGSPANLPSVPEPSSCRLVLLSVLAFGWIIDLRKRRQK